MSKTVTSNEEFTASRNGWRQLVVDANGGTATIQAKGGTVWVDVTDGQLAVDGMLTFYAVSGQVFRVTLTGSAAAWLAG